MSTNARYPDTLVAGRGGLFLEIHSLWIHGHIHESFDYKIGKTRVVCNPRGYASIEENKGFRPDYTLVV